jgi:hypothetical protein
MEVLQQLSQRPRSPEEPRPARTRMGSRPSRRRGEAAPARLRPVRHPLPLALLADRLVLDPAAPRRHRRRAALSGHPRRHVEQRHPSLALPPRNRDAPVHRRDRRDPRVPLTRRGKPRARSRPRSRHLRCSRSHVRTGRRRRQSPDERPQPVRTRRLDRARALARRAGTAATTRRLIRDAVEARGSGAVTNRSAREMLAMPRTWTPIAANTKTLA